MLNTVLHIVLGDLDQCTVLLLLQHGVHTIPGHLNYSNFDLSCTSESGVEEWRREKSSKSVAKEKNES